MKNKIIAVLLSSALVLSVSACGSTPKEKQPAGDTTEQTPSISDTQSESPEGVFVSESRSFDLNGTDYVTSLCDYSEIPVTIAGDYEVTPEKADIYLGQLMAGYGPFYVPDETKTAVGEGDIVNVDYVGKLDGTPFDNGSASDQNIDVDNNCAAGQASSGFIPGFTDALKNAKVGDVIDADVTFPENYGNADLAGKAVVFTFTVNSIQRVMTTADVDDAFAKQLFDVDTVDEMYERINNYLTAASEMAKQSDTAGALQDYLVENCKLDLPQDYLEARFNDYRSYFITSNCQGDESMLENYLSSYYGKSVEETEQLWKDNIREQVSMEFILDAVAEKEGIEFNEEDFNTFLDSMVAGGTYNSVDDLYSEYGYGDTEYGKMYTKKVYVENLALNKIKETAVITEQSR